MIFDILYYIIISPIELLIETFYSFISTVVRYNPVFPLLGISIVVNILCLPLYAKAESLQEIERQKQNLLKNKITSIKKNFRGNERYMLLSMYYRENNYHPLMSLRGVLSLLIQIPFFIAAYHFISNLEILKGTGFFFIQNLAKPDGILVLGNGLVINILPIIMTVINVISGYIYSKNLDKKEKLQLLGMSLLFLLLLYNSPSALVLYWTFNNIFSLFKNIIYKLPNPLKVFYFIIIIFLVFSCMYVFFFRSQGKSGSLLFKSLAFSISLIIALVPLFCKFFNFWGKKYFSHLNIYNNEIRNSFFIAIISLWILCGLIIPLNIISSDTPAFSYLGNLPSPFSLMLPSLFISMGIFIFWPCCIFLLFSKKTKACIFLISAIMLFFGIINTFLFFNNYGTMSQILTFFSDTVFKHSSLQITLNFFIFVLIVLSLLLIILKSKIRLLSAILSVVLISGIFITVWKTITIQKEYNIVSIIKQKNEAGTDNPVSNTGVKEKLTPIINLSMKYKNVIVLMLDRAIGSYFPLILNERPELNRAYSGFTYYPNTVSFFRSTLLGAPPIFGGYEYTPIKFHSRSNVSMADKNDEALLLMPLLFQKENYDVSVYDLPNVNYQDPMDASFFSKKGIYAESLVNKYYTRFISDNPDKAPVNFVNYDEILKHNFVFFGFFSIAPPALRKAIYRKGSYWAIHVPFNDNSISQGVISEYSALYYLPQLTSYENENAALTLMVSNLPHSPSFLQYPDYTIESTISDFGPELFNGNITSQKHYHVNAASYLLLAKWFDELRLNNVYDNTKIIIVSDHDELVVKPLFSEELNRINTFYNPVLLVKDFNSDGDIKTDMTFMTTADVPLLALAGIIPNPVNPFTGNILKADKDNGVDIYLGGSAYTRDFPSWEALEKTSSFYHVKDNIFDEKNWTKITRRY